MADVKQRAHEYALTVLKLIAEDASRARKANLQGTRNPNFIEIYEKAFDAYVAWANSKTDTIA